MNKYKLIVLTNPISGMEREYNRWYQYQHLNDFVRIPGVVNGQRYETVGSCKWRFAAIYNIHTHDSKLVIDTAMRLSGTPDMPLSNALDLTDSFSLVISPLGNRIEKQL